jgi:hypothetical protein
VRDVPVDASGADAEAFDSEDAGVGAGDAQPVSPSSAIVKARGGVSERVVATKTSRCGFGDTRRR